MANVTTYLENKLLEHSLGKNSWTMPTSTKAGLFIVSPDASYVSGTPGSAVEVTSLYGYSRQTVTWATAASGSIANSAALTWTSTTGPWRRDTASSTPEKIVSIGIFASATDNLLWFGPLSASVTIDTGQSFTIDAGNFVLTLS
jgi:hypothetical protein